MQFYFFCGHCFHLSLQNLMAISIDFADECWQIGKKNFYPGIGGESEGHVAK